MERSSAVLEPDVETRELTELAPRWKLILLNDPVTTFEFVTDLLISLFKKDRDEARKLTYEVHLSGQALITVVSKERAELYTQQIQSLARPRGFPLTATIEPA